MSFPSYGAQSTSLSTGPSPRAGEGGYEQPPQTGRPSDQEGRRQEKTFFCNSEIVVETSLAGVMPDPCLVNDSHSP